MYYVYILKLSNKKHYVGWTRNLRRRFIEHEKGQQRTTKNYLPVELVCYISFKSKNVSLKFEKYLKSGSGNAFRNKHLI